MVLFVSWGNKFVVIECPPFDAPKSTHGVFTSFSLSRCCCLHFCRNKFGLMLAQGYFKSQRSSIIHILQLFMTLCDMQSLSGHYFDAPSSTHGVFTSLVNLSDVACISVEISLGSCWCRDILRVKDQGLITNCNFLWPCVLCNHQVVTLDAPSSTHGVFTSFNLSKCCYLHFWNKKFGSMLAQGYFKGQKSSMNQKL